MTFIASQLLTYRYAVDVRLADLTQDAIACTLQSLPKRPMELRVTTAAVFPWMIRYARLIVVPEGCA